MVKLHSFDTKIHEVDSDTLVYPTRTMKTMADYDNLSIHILFTRKIGTEDVLLKVLFCGMDHTDLHQIRSEIYPSSFPLVPGLFSYNGINKDGTCTQGGSSSAKVCGKDTRKAGTRAGSTTTMCRSDSLQSIEAVQRFQLESQGRNSGFSWWGCKAPAHDLILGRKTITGSFVGSIETREILDFWAEKDLSSMIEVVKMDYANKAFEGMERNDVRYRFVLDVAGSNMK
ncbi:hypothetical protein QYF36_018020 [Acer negundo]|nr:hypothetical protein QYF36_018020 [Acer negundo]